MSDPKRRPRSQALVAGLLRAITRLLRENSGAIAIVTALMLPVFLGFIALAIDVSYWYLAKRTLQTAADAAAISGAHEVANNHSDRVATAARADAADNGYDSSIEAEPITVNNPPANGPNAGKKRFVEVIIDQSVPLIISGLFLNTPPDVQVRAVAGVQSGEDEFCLGSLLTSANPGVDLEEAEQVTMTGCGIGSNSSVDIGALTQLTITKADPSLSAVGGIEGAAGTNVNIPEAETIRKSQPPINDPYRDLPVPSDPVCNFDNKEVVADETLQPGRYCGGLTIRGGVTVTFDPGPEKLPFTIAGGEFSVKGHSEESDETGNPTLVGEGVTIILTNNIGNGFATLQIAAGQVDLSAPTSGAYAGVLFFQDRNAPSTQGASTDLVSNTIDGGAHLDVTGALYFPSQELALLDTQFTAINQCAQLIAGQLTVSGDTQLTLENSGCPSVGGKTLGRITVRLAE